MLNAITAGLHTSAGVRADWRAYVTPRTGSTEPELRTRAALPAAEEGIARIARERSESGRVIIAELLEPLGGEEPREGDGRQGASAERLDA